MVFYDQLERSVHLPQWPPRRIISVVPSQTELLHAFGLEEEVVGITKFCLHPAVWFKEKSRVGGTKTLNLQKIDALRPDLIIGNKEENEQEQIETLARRYPVWLSDVTNLHDALDMMLRIGSLTDRATAARDLTDRIRTDFDDLENRPAPARLRAAYLIWRKPYMVAAADTFIHDMLLRAGFTNVFGSRTRYPQITLPELAEARPDVLLLSSEPYPFQEKHVAELREVCPAARIELADGEAFSWYGSRLLESPPYFRQLWQRVTA